ncbi:MAG: bifunctional DNA-formamidopyrimidine glycosylase/DNA-(apurinic or apyrimidinic site) lyase [Candidatus Margulisiibacteriota bacterium]
MPELPEVETIRRDIEPYIKGRAIKAVGAIRAKNVLKGIKAKRLEKALKGQRIERVERRGKYLIFKLASGNCLIIHLGMTGKILKKPDRFVKVTFHLSNGKSFYFSDIRMFGKVSFSKTYPVLNLGPEPLADDFTANRLKEMLKGRGGNLKALLLNQKFLAGVGNIYASEALFLAGINPKRRAGSLKFAEVKKLHKSLREVLLAGIKYRGTSVSDYRDASGRIGGYQHRLKVYDREGRFCKKCRSKIRRIVIGQRSTFFCPHCQS